MEVRPCNNHQGLHKIQVDGVKPPEHEWYECNRCRDQLLLHIVTSRPQNGEVREAQQKGVRIIKEYEAVDGSVWGDMDQAVARNLLIRELEEVESFLIPRTKELEEGDGYIQQDARQVAEFHSRLTNILARTLEKPVAETDNVESLYRAVCLIILNDNPFPDLYKRRASIDEFNREWQNPEIAADWRNAGRMIELSPDSSAPKPQVYKSQIRKIPVYKREGKAG